MIKIRFAVIGVGQMGREHAGTIVQARDKEFCLSAVADANPELARQAGEEFNVPYYSDAQALLDSRLADAVIVATPHYLHPPLVIRAARAGMHVLCEKPLAVTVGSARAMVAECRRGGVALGAMFQGRARPIARTMKRLIDGGRLGHIHHVEMISSGWYRTQAYYDSGAWRGTWDGEGGGILLNQASHYLDLYQWLFGMPRRVFTILQTRLHRIEVENTANVLCQHADGTVVYLYVTTAELPKRDTLLICGDKGSLLAEESSRLKIAALSEPISRHMFSCQESRADYIPQPDFAWKEVRLPAERGSRRLEVIRAFVRHVLHGKALIASGEEAVNQVELTNAMYISGYRNKSVELPVNAAEMERLLARQIRERSTGRGLGLRRQAQRDMGRLLKT